MASFPRRQEGRTAVKRVPNLGPEVVAGVMLVWVRRPVGIQVRPNRPAAVELHAAPVVSIILSSPWM